MGRAISAFNGPGDELPPKQESAAVLLAAGKTLQQTASELKAGETTLKTWLRDPTFVRRVTALRGEMTSRAVGLLVDGYALAATKLRQLCAKSKSERVVLLAAKALIDSGTRLREASELEAEVQMLREQVAALANSRGRVR